MSPRALKRQARRDIHLRMAVPALYIFGDEDPVPVTVRDHTKFSVTGRLQGSMQWAGDHEPTPRLVFLLEQGVEPRRGGVVSIEAGEAYRVDSVQPKDDITQVAFVTVLDAADAAGLPVPA